MSIKSAFLTFFGDIKVLKWPPFLYYDPYPFKITGQDTRDIQKAIQPGDLILRRYDCYLDGYFIPGKYSHTGMYVGDGKVIHAVAEGVSMIDLVEFCRTDNILVLRADDEKAIEVAIARAHKWLADKVQYDFSFKSDNNVLYCHELGAEAYKEFNLEKFKPRLFGFIPLPGMAAKYLSESFYKNEHFSVVISHGKVKPFEEKD